MSKLCVSKLCDDKLCVDKLCVSKLCVSSCALREIDVRSLLNIVRTDHIKSHNSPHHAVSATSTFF